MIQNFRTDRSGQTLQTLIRLLLEEQSDSGLHCLLFDLHLFDEIPLIAWSHRRTDMYRRENGLKYAEFGYPVTKFISSAAQSSRNRHVEPVS